MLIQNEQWTHATNIGVCMIVEANANTIVWQSQEDLSKQLEGYSSVGTEIVVIGALLV